jgi:hypothetical protein
MQEEGEEELVIKKRGSMKVFLFSTPLGAGLFIKCRKALGA